MSAALPARSAGSLLQLRAIEIAAGAPIGSAETDVPWPRPAGDPRAALEAVIERALRRPPCVVSFSGGRDSSAVLAVATAVARRAGLPDPVPMTLRFPGAPSSDEDDWQELVVRHLGLADWERRDYSDELDLVGPIAAAALRRHGLLWPPNTHFHQPLLDEARGGAVLTGIDGDGLFASWRHRRLGLVLSRRAKPVRRDLSRLLLGVAPRGLRAVVERRRPTPAMAWLRPAATAELGRLWAREAAAEPARWDRWVRWYAHQRALRFVLEGFDRLALDAGVLAVHPFAEPELLASLAGAGRRFGLGDRTSMMRLLAGDVLPEEVVARQSKASLDGAFWCRHSRAFAAAWEGSGVDAELVDPDALRAEWQQPAPHAASSTLLQTAWLAAAPTSDEPPR